MKSTTLLLAPFAFLFLSACGGSGSGGDDAPAPPPSIPAKAVLTVAPASIELIAQSETPVTLTVANTSNTITVTAISALLPSSWTDVVQDAGGCASLPPQTQCTLSFMPGDDSHPSAKIAINGHNADPAAATIVVSPFNGAVIEPLTATEVSLEPGMTATMVVRNSSATVTATNISARLDGTPLAGALTQDASSCASVAPGASCAMQFTALNTAVTRSSFSIRGDNTTQLGGAIEIALPTVAQIAVTGGSPLVLQATAGTPAVGVLTITNQSTLLTATNITASFGGTALDGHVTETGNTCATLAPNASCTLTFTPGSNAVAQTTFSISGDNTSTAGASIVIDAPQAMISVTGSPLTLIAGGTGGSLTVTNTSMDTAVNVAANFTGTALDGQVIQSSPPCTLLYMQSCLLTFTPGSTAVPSTSFTIAGSNTQSVVANMNIISLAVGDSYAGGIVLRLPSGGMPGTIINTVETMLPWGPTTAIGGAGANDDDDGAANTAAIVLELGAGTGYAAGYCDAYSYVDGGVTYSDWYLPAHHELDVLIGVSDSNSLGVFSGFYWSSRELNASNAFFRISGSSGGTATTGKSSTNVVRCARAFTL